MSNAQTRQDIADALSTVAGIHGYAARPSTLSEGDGWPQWRGGVPRRGAVENTWAVLIVVPQADDVTADAFADSHGAALIEALETRDVLAVDSIAPAEIATEGGPIYALMISGRSE